MIRSYFKETALKSLSCIYGNRVKSDDERESPRTGNERRANKRTLDRRNIWRLASESTVSLGRPPIGDFSRISFLRRPHRRVANFAPRSRLTGQQADAHLRFLVNRKESAHITASFSLISLSPLAYPRVLLPT